MTGTKTLLSIQALRALAALAVAIAHTYGIIGIKYGVASYPTLITGAGGVDLFFVISGFIMVYSSDRLFDQPSGPPRFLLRRVIRIVPLYWLVTSFMVCYLLWQYGNLALAGASWTSVVHSFFFIPYVGGEPLFPIVGVGWTLNYEMFFYVLFSGCLIFARRTAVIVLSLALTMFGLFGRSFNLPTALAYLADPIILEFVFGVVIGFAYREFNGPAKIISATLLAIGAAGFVSTAVFDLSFLSRVIIWGIPSACLVSGAILIGEASTNHFWRAATFLGDISYSLYLTHGISMGAMKVMNPIINPGKSPWLYACTLVGFALVVATCVYLIFEKPATDWLRQKFSFPAGDEPLRNESQM
jgi:exopolysaccharide production protein ExoZ